MCPGPSPRDKPEKFETFIEETTEHCSVECSDLSASASAAHFPTGIHLTVDHKDHSSCSPGSRLHETTPLIQTTFRSRQRSSKKSTYCFYDFYPYFLLYLFGSSSFPPNLNTIFEPNIGLTKSSTPDISAMENSREFFDPMIGSFKASNLNSTSDFFTSKLRWRNDAELAAHAWKQSLPNLQSQPIAVNMLLTEQPSCPEWNPLRRDTGSMQTVATSSNISDEAQPSQQTTDDLSLMDCDAIDVYWRRDIEQEKGFIPSMHGPGTSPDDTVTEQFERDLQLLTEKSLLAPLSSEERYQYENLAKAQYTDFYTSVAQPYAPPKVNGYSPHGRVLTDISYNRPSSSHATGTTQKDYFAAAYTTIKPLPSPEEPEATLNFSTFSNQSVLFNNVSLSEARQPNNHLNVSDLLSPLGQQSPRYMSESEDLDSLLQVQIPRLFPDDSDWNEFFHSPQVKADINASLPWNASSLSDTEMKPSSSNSNDLYKMDNSRSQRTSFSSLEDSLVYGHNETTRDFHNPTPSSGFGSIDSPTSSYQFDMSRYVSPTDFSIRPSSPPTSRFHGKLVPNKHVNQQHGDDGTFLSTLMKEAGILDEVESDIEYDDSELDYEPSVGDNNMNQPRRRGRQSKDDQLVAQHGLSQYGSAEEFATMSHQQIQQLMREPNLTAVQKQIIKKINCVFTTIHV